MGRMDMYLNQAISDTTLVSVVTHGRRALEKAQARTGEHVADHVSKSTVGAVDVCVSVCAYL